jgi:hypothetical protein
MDFEATYAKTTSALGSDSLEAAIDRAATLPLPPQATRYTSQHLRRLVAVCYHLQKLQGVSPFFLSVRAAAKLMGLANPTKASCLLFGLVNDGILTEVEKGQRGGRRATRYRFNLTSGTSQPDPSQTTGKDASPKTLPVRPIR